MLKKFSGQEWFSINESFRAGSYGREMQDRLKASRAKKGEKEEKEDKGEKEDEKESQQKRDIAHSRRMRNQNAGLGEEVTNEDPNDPTSKWSGEPKKEKPSLFVGSISPRPGLHKIMLTDSGHVVLVYQDSFEGASSRWTGHVHSHPDGELVKYIKIDPAEIGE
tara:strand:+ start:182 stop:673 length:492 start_codon:yes stop_codon:yes gene_type:complete